MDSITKKCSAPTVIGKIDLPEPKRKGILYCDDCKAPVSDAWGDPRTQITHLQGGRHINLMVCEQCINDKYWGISDAD